MLTFTQNATFSMKTFKVCRLTDFNYYTLQMHVDQEMNTKKFSKPHQKFQVSLDEAAVENYTSALF